jgi:hypothetical protein
MVIPDQSTAYERNDLELPTTTCDLENNENAPSFRSSDPTAASVQGTFVMREFVVEQVFNRGLTRPFRTMERNI